MSEKIKVSIRGIIDDLSNGITRCKGDAGYSEELGSIQEKYGLTKSQINRMFKHPQLKGRRVHVAVDDPFELIDDVGDETITTSSYGERSASSQARAEAANSEDESQSEEDNDWGLEEPQQSNEQLV